jgi:hypothetical protein
MDPASIPAYQRERSQYRASITPLEQSSINNVAHATATLVKPCSTANPALAWHFCPVVSKHVLQEMSAKGHSQAVTAIHLSHWQR